MDARYAIAASDAFLAATAAVILCAPVAGAALRVRHVALGLAAFVLVSFALAALAATRSGVPLGLAARGHLALAVVALALAGIGAAAASLARHRLDAAGAALLVALIATAAVLAGGPRTAQLSEAAIDAALLANPLVAVTAAAEMDILRSEVFYQLAPVSHRRFTYPAWPLTLLTYGTLAACCLTFAGLRTRQKGPFA